MLQFFFLNCSHQTVNTAHILLPYRQIRRLDNANPPAHHAALLVAQTRTGGVRPPLHRARDVDRLVAILLPHLEEVVRRRIRRDIPRVSQSAGPVVAVACTGFPVAVPRRAASSGRAQQLRQVAVGNGLHGGTAGGDDGGVDLDGGRGEADVVGRVGVDGAGEEGLDELGETPASDGCSTGRISAEQ